MKNINNFSFFHIGKFNFICFECRRRAFQTTSSESGFSDAPTEEEEDDQSIAESVAESEAVSVEESVTENETAESQVQINTTDPYQIQICPENEMSASTLTIKAPEETTDDILSEDISQSELTIPIFIPSLDYVAGVPSELLPPFFPSEDPILRLGLDGANAIPDNVDENYEELYSKLIASTARSAALANRLAEIHR